MRWWWDSTGSCPPIIVTSSALLLQLPACFSSICPGLLWLPTANPAATGGAWPGAAKGSCPARLAALAALLGVLQPLPAAEAVPDCPKNCCCAQCCCGAWPPRPLRDSACCSSPGEEACRRGVLLPLPHAQPLCAPTLLPSTPTSLRQDGERSAYACGVSGQSNPTTRGDAGTYRTPLLAGEGGTVMLARPAGRRLLLELVRGTAAPCGGRCMGVVCAEPASASETDPLEE